MDMATWLQRGQPTRIGPDLNHPGWNDLAGIIEMSRGRPLTLGTRESNMVEDRRGQGAAAFAQPGISPFALGAPPLAFPPQLDLTFPGSFAGSAY